MYFRCLYRVMSRCLITTALCHQYVHYQILIGNQFGFRKLHSSYMALMLKMDQLTKAFDNSEKVIGIFLDFSKVLDTVNHAILLDKLHHYGVRGNALDWFRSYLSNRKQHVSTMALAPARNRLHVVFRKGLYLDHYCSWSTLMTCTMYVANLCLYYLLMIPIFSLKEPISNDYWT